MPQHGFRASPRTNVTEGIGFPSRGERLRKLRSRDRERKYSLSIAYPLGMRFNIEFTDYLRCYRLQKSKESIGGVTRRQALLSIQLRRNSAFTWW